MKNNTYFSMTLVLLELAFASIFCMIAFSCCAFREHPHETVKVPESPIVTKPDTPPATSSKAPDKAAVTVPLSVPVMKTDTVPLAIPSPTVQLPSSQYYFKVEWKKGDADSEIHHLSRGLLQPDPTAATYVLNAPITLTEIIPDHLDIDVTLPAETPEFAKGDLMVFVKAHPSDYLTGENEIKVSPSEMAYALTKDAEGRDQVEEKVTISGLRNILPDSEEKSAYFSIEFRFAQNQFSLATIDFTLSTPPRKIAFTQRTLSDYEKTLGVLPLGIKSLESESVKISLIQVIDAQNQSDQPLMMDFPIQLQGLLFQKRRFLYPHGGGPFETATCNEQTEVTEELHLFAKEFYLLPIQKDLDQLWLKFLAETTLSVLLSQGEVRSIGVFAKASDSNAESDLLTILPFYNPKRFATENSVKSIAVPSVCNFGCKHPETSTRFMKQCEAVPEEKPDVLSQCVARVNACNPCIDRWRKRLPNNIGHPTEWGPDCNECHEKELKEGHQIYSYQGGFACEDGWDTSVVSTRNNQEGEQVDNISLSLEISSVFASLRYAHSNRKDDPEFRKISFINGSTIQEQ